MKREDRLEARKKLAEKIAGLPFKVTRNLGISDTTTSKCKHGEVPAFRLRSLKRLMEKLIV